MARHPHSHTIPYTWFDLAEELPEDESGLLESAAEATLLAHAPYSQFRVGCALLLADGEIIQGNNQENAAFPSGLCAERIALFTAGSAGKAGLVRKIAIRAFSDRMTITQPPMSCGGCRQVMVEYEKAGGSPWVVLFQGAVGPVLRLEGVAQSLMPFRFEGDF